MSAIELRRRTPNFFAGISEAENFLVRALSRSSAVESVCESAADTFQSISFRLPNFLRAYFFGVCPPWSAWFSSTPWRCRYSRAPKISSKSRHSEKEQKRKCKALALFLLEVFDTFAPNSFKIVKARSGLLRVQARWLNQSS